MIREFLAVILIIVLLVLWCSSGILIVSSIQKLIETRRKKVQDE